MAIVISTFMQSNYKDLRKHNYCAIAGHIVIDFINHILTAPIGRIRSNIVMPYC